MTTTQKYLEARRLEASSDPADQAAAEVLWTEIEKADADRAAATRPATPPTSLHDLPIFGWAWAADGRELRA